MSAGEEETDLDLGDLIKKGEVAWLSTQEMMKASEAAQNGEPIFHLPCSVSPTYGPVLRVQRQMSTGAVQEQPQPDCL